MQKSGGWWFADSKTALPAGQLPSRAESNDERDKTITLSSNNRQCQQRQRVESQLRCLLANIYFTPLFTDIIVTPDCNIAGEPQTLKGGQLLHRIMFNKWVHKEYMKNI